MAKPTPEQIAASAVAAQRKRTRHVAAYKQADIDAVAKPKSPSMDVKPGEEATLHQLNTQARAINRVLHDEVRDASIAAAKAVSGVLGGVSESTKKIAKRLSRAGAAPSKDDVVPPGAKEPKVEGGRRKPAAK